MIGKTSDENSLKKIVSNGIIPAIINVLYSEESDGRTVDSKVAEITNLVNAYNDFFMTGRHIAEKEQK